MTTAPEGATDTAQKKPSPFGEGFSGEDFGLGNRSLLQVMDGRSLCLANLGEVGGAGAQSKAHRIGFADAQGEHDGGQSRLCFSFPTEGSAEGFVGFVCAFGGGDVSHNGDDSSLDYL